MNIKITNTVGLLKMTNYAIT